MKKMINKVSKHFNNKGLTLVEVLVSIILISLVLFTFFSFLIQSAKTGKTSEEVVDGTYLAQLEMEKLYEVSRKEDFNSGIDEIVNSLTYKQITSTTQDEYVFEKSIDGKNIKLKLKEHSYPGMSYLVIEVFDQENGTRPRAKMETILEWGS
jgi:prepilin-type N-terminal cleavage/methylation domain-containing protein